MVSQRIWRYVRQLSVCLMLAALARADIQVRSSGPYLTLGRNLAWGSGGSGGIENIWTFVPMNPNQGICIFVTNNDSASHSFTLNVYQTGDSSIPQYTGYSKFFRPDAVQGAYSPVAANATTTAFVQTSAAARIAVQITGSSPSGGTANVYVVQTTSGSCGPVNAGTVSVQGSQPDGATFTANPVVVAGNALGAVKVMGVLTGNASGGNTVLVVPWNTCITAQAVPTVLTNVTTVDSKITQMWFTNTTAAAISVTVQDGQATPRKLLSNASIAPNTTQVISFQWPLWMTGGISWVASASGLDGQICLW